VWGDCCYVAPSGPAYAPGKLIGGAVTATYSKGIVPVFLNPCTSPSAKRTTSPSAKGAVVSFARSRIPDPRYAIHTGSDVACRCRAFTGPGSTTILAVVTRAEVKFSGNSNWCNAMPGSASAPDRVE